MTTVRQWANFIPRVRASSPSRTQEDCPSCHDMVAKKSDEAVEWPIQPCAPFPPLGTTMHIVTVEGRKREHSHASSFPIVGHLSDQLLDHEFGEDDPRLLNCCSISGTNSPSTSSSGALLHGDGGTDALPEHWTIANALAEPTPTPIEDDAPLPPRLAADGLGEHDAAVHLSQPAFSSLPGSVQGDKVGGIGGSSCCSRERFDAASSTCSESSASSSSVGSRGDRGAQQIRRRKPPPGLPPASPDRRQIQSWCSVPICSPLPDRQANNTAGNRALENERRVEWLQDSVCRV
mmetsp:Transcript_39836/g.79667  ORF Transcript_39836/g.79667 Transcript_39836/m.79667 type:complete len:291 (-) Transcript_39836:227-1099(-)